MDQYVSEIYCQNRPSKHKPTCRIDISQISSSLLKERKKAAECTGKYKLYNCINKIKRQESCKRYTT